MQYWLLPRSFREQWRIFSRISCMSWSIPTTYWFWENWYWSYAFTARSTEQFRTSWNATQEIQVSFHDAWSHLPRICCVRKWSLLLLTRFVLFKRHLFPQTSPSSSHFLGLINYYSCFLSNLSTLLAPLYCLLQMNSKWTWGPEQQEALKLPRIISHLHQCWLTPEWPPTFSDL